MKAAFFMQTKAELTMQEVVETRSKVFGQSCSFN